MALLKSMAIKFHQIGSGGENASFVLPVGTTCQDEIEKDILTGNAIHTTRSWMQLKHVLQNIKGKSIATMFAKCQETDVVVKVQYADKTNVEWKSRKQLTDDGNLEGFIPFICKFSCEGDKDYIDMFGPTKFIPTQPLCRKRGSTMGIILMPYYDMGSLEAYMSNKMNTEKVQTALYVIQYVVQKTFIAFKIKGFTHGDLFCKNVVLKTSKSGAGQHDVAVAIIDFELSQFQKNVMQFWRDINEFIGDVARQFYTHTTTQTVAHDLDMIARDHVFMNMAYGKDPDEDGIQALTNSIQDLIKKQ